MNKLKIGIVGCGGIARNRHIPAFQELNEITDIVAVHDINYDLAKNVAENNNIEFVMEDYQQMFELVDAIAVCTPNKFHAEISIVALNSGVHVFCEKPMALNKLECERMVEAANHSGKLLAIGYHYRFTDAAMTAKKAILNGAVGDPLVIRTQALRRRKVPGWGVFTNKLLQGGGSLIDYGCHLLDLSLWLLEDNEPVEILAKTYNRLSKTPNQINDWGTFNHETFDVDDHVSCFIIFKDNASMQFECSWAANIKDDSKHLSISGVDGGISLYPFELYQHKYGTCFTEKAVVDHDETLAAKRQATNFVKSCLGEADLVVKPEEAQRTSLIIDAIYKSSVEGRSIRLSNV